MTAESAKLFTIREVLRHADRVLEDDPLPPLGSDSWICVFESFAQTVADVSKSKMPGWVLKAVREQFQQRLAWFSQLSWGVNYIEGTKVRQGCRVQVWLRLRQLRTSRLPRALEHACGRLPPLLLPPLLRTLAAQAPKPGTWEVEALQRLHLCHGMLDLVGLGGSRGQLRHEGGFQS